MEQIRLEDVSKTYQRGPVSVPVLRGVSLSVAAGEMVAVMGVSGSGKTTLVNLLGLLDRPSSGAYRLDGEDVSRLSGPERALLRGRKIGFVFQCFNLLPRSTALENVLLPLAYTAPELSARECRERARQLLWRVGLGDRMEHRPSELSGGEQQRVAIARALVSRPAVLIADEPTGNLDSQTGKEVMDVFGRLNAEDGLTILLVTHDSWVAHHAGRVIRIRDGSIEEESAPAGGRGPTSAPAGPPPPPRRVSRALAAARGLTRTVGTALHALRRNVLRSGLTALGIIIGVAALLAVLELGAGSAAAIKRRLVSVGATNIVVQAGPASRNGVSLGSGTTRTLTPEDADAIRRECPSVSAVAPLVVSRGQVVYRGRNWNTLYIYGTTPDFLEVRDWQELEEGEPFTAEDVRDGNMVCLLGQTLAGELFQGQSPLGQEVCIGDARFRVIGVLRRKGTNMIGTDQDDIFLAPWTTIKARVSGTSGVGAAPPDAAGSRYPGTPAGLYPGRSPAQLANEPQLVRFANVDYLLVQVPSPEEIPAACRQITQLLHDRHRIAPGEKDDFGVRDFAEVIAVVNGTVRLLTGVLLIVALVSLMVGGIGIMNIMMVSVTERTREIGLRMAVGATAGAVLWQFLVEAVVLCLLGGALGILLGRAITLLAWRLARCPSESSSMALLAAVGVSLTIGVLFGYYPAWRASRLDPIEALRYE